MPYLTQHRRSDTGVWWTGHHSVELKDPVAYCAAVEKNTGMKTRVVDNETGEIFGEQACSFCGSPHDGVEGSCLL